MSFPIRVSAVCAALCCLAPSLLAQGPYFSGTSSFGLRGPSVRYHTIQTEAYYRPSRPVHRQPAEDDDIAPSEAPADETPYDTPALDTKQPVVPGNRAVFRRGIAYAPANAPDNVKRAIWAVNTLRRMPYVWGGGHGSFSDNGYDCSGAVSFALHHAGLLNSPQSSRDLMGWGSRGHGRWITVYAQNGHVFAVIAGLRLDTTGFRGNEGPRWRTSSRSGWGFTARHFAGF